VCATIDDKNHRYCTEMSTDNLSDSSEVLQIKFAAQICYQTVQCSFSCYSWGG
jgi:hypothetical protein